MPPEKLAARSLLESAGVDAATGVAWRFDPEQVKAVVARWEEKRADGEDLGAGWIVWRLKQGPIAATKAKAATDSGWQERYERGKARLAERGRCDG